jgi:hypothetical protein
VAIDGSSLQLTDRQREKGFGTIGASSVGAHGLKVISALAIEPNGATQDCSRRSGGVTSLLLPSSCLTTSSACSSRWRIHREVLRRAARQVASRSTQARLRREAPFAEGDSRRAGRITGRLTK